MRVIVSDDQTLFRKGLRRLLEHEGDIDIVGEAGDGVEAIASYKQHQPDLLIQDIEMPKKDGLDVTKEILSEFPDAKILILSVHDDLEHASRTLKAGALGFVSKNSDPDQLRNAIRTVANGQRYLPAELRASLAEAFLGGGAGEGLKVLSDREFQVLCLIAAGHPNRDIADQLHISTKTVDSHRAKVLKKLGLRNNADIARYAVRHRLVPA